MGWVFVLGNSFSSRITEDIDYWDIFKMKYDSAALYTIKRKDSEMPRAIKSERNECF